MLRFLIVIVALLFTPLIAVGFVLRVALQAVYVGWMIVGDLDDEA